MCVCVRARFLLSRGVPSPGKVMYKDHFLGLIRGKVKFFLGGEGVGGLELG